MPEDSVNDGELGGTATADPYLVPVLLETLRQGLADDGRPEDADFLHSTPPSTSVSG